MCPAWNFNHDAAARASPFSTARNHVDSHKMIGIARALPNAIANSVYGFRSLGKYSPSRGAKSSLPHLSQFASVERLTPTAPAITFIDAPARATKSAADCASGVNRVGWPDMTTFYLARARRPVQVSQVSRQDRGEHFRWPSRDI